MVIQFLLLYIVCYPFLGQYSYFTYPVKTPENQRFSGDFRVYKMGILPGNGLREYFIVEKYEV